MSMGQIENQIGDNTIFYAGFRRLIPYLVFMTEIMTNRPNSPNFESN